MTHDPSTPAIKLLTAEQVAEQIGLSVSTLAKLRLSTALGGGIPFLKIGAAVRYRSDDVDAWILSRPRRKSTSEQGIDK